MKQTLSRRIISALIALVMIVGMMPISMMPVFAGHTCPDCRDWIDGSPYCSECYRCDACAPLCVECGECSECSGYEICTSCSDAEIGDNMCMQCVFDRGTHCPSCEECYVGVHAWCEECGLCTDCVEYDVGCSSEHGRGLCVDCAYDYGLHCFGCGTCYFECSWCEECGLCTDCSEHDAGCSSEVGAVLCKECAKYSGHHCPSCDTCYFDIGYWCEECGQCRDCSDICEYCSSESGERICTECAIDMDMHCPECSECYGESGGEFCIECNICANCAEICVSHELCIDCAVSEGYHCPGCESCAEDGAICEDCGERCINCADEFCENCNLCSECVLFCDDCGSCSSCAEICPNCEEHCSECEGICDDCGLCLVCCQDNAYFEGCDCDEWVCTESTDWDEHYSEEHTEITQGTHSIRASLTWSWDRNYHWHECVYCEEASHRTSSGKHTYDSKGDCTVCQYSPNTAIKIMVQPKDSKSAYVCSNVEAHDETNIAHFSVVAYGEGELTYTWYAGYYNYNLGKIKYILLDDPAKGEIFDGPNAAILVSTDACYSDWYVRCVITDENGNEVVTRDALMQAKHNYQYFESYKTNEDPYELAERNSYGHILQCVGEGCGKVSLLRPHEDENEDRFCDVCDFKLDSIYISKQPKNVSNVLVKSPDEDPDESNMAHFSVEAKGGEGELTYTWCRRYYSGGKLVVRPLAETFGEPAEGECFYGPDLYVFAPTDSCTSEYTFCCIVSDEAGNETMSTFVTLKARHNYQYYKFYQSHTQPLEYAKTQSNGHFLVCVGEECEKKNKFNIHKDENNDYLCDVCDYRSKIDWVNLTITAPKEKKYPNYSVSCDTDACYAYGRMNNGIYWFVSDNGVDNWKLIDNTTPFVAGKYYKISVDLKARDGYEFDKHYEYNSKVVVTVNGGRTFYAEKTYNKELSHYVTVEYDFGLCNDSVIENIVIKNVTEPVAGEKPTYTAEVRGSGYYIDSDYNESYDAYWKNPPEEWPYIVNGIGWYDLTKGDWMYSHESFVAGHEYKVRVYLKTEDGYTFYHDKWYEMLFTASINGFVASGNSSGSQGLYEQTISTSFTCHPKEITTVMVNGLATPKAGETPDYTANAAYPEWYQIDSNYSFGGIIWYDSDENMLDYTDTFVGGKKYKVEIKLVPTKLNGADTAQFVSPVSAYVNGKEVVANGEWDAVYTTKNAVYIYYTFPKGASGDSFISGDADGDEDVTTRDVLLIRKVLGGLLDEDAMNINAADVDGDGEVTTRDVLKIRKYLGGLIDTLD